MGGGLLQLVAYGAQDIYLTGNPQITFFKVVYRRHTNFSIESVEQTFNGGIDFGNKVLCSIARSGDLVSNMYLRVTLPALNQTQSSATYHGYVNSIGNAIIKEVEIKVGGQAMDKQYGDWMEIWGELTNTSSRFDGYCEMVGKYESAISLQSNATAAKTYNVPIPFWFCRNPGLALPLIALQYHEVVIDLTFRPLNELTVSDVAITTAQDSTGSTASITNASLWVDYVYLDTDERRRFAQNSHEYLIEQLQFNGLESLAASTSTFTADLGFNHPCKELLWIITRDSNTQASTSAGNDRFNFSAGGSESFNNVKLQFNGQERFVARDARYFRTVQPYNHHTRVPTKHIYSYSFGLRPEEHQPSGTCNMSRLDNVTMKFNFASGISSSSLKIYGVNYNVLRIMSGMAGLAYSN